MTADSGLRQLEHIRKFAHAEALMGGLLQQPYDTEADRIAQRFEQFDPRIRGTAAPPFDAGPLPLCRRCSGNNPFIRIE